MPNSNFYVLSRYKKGFTLVELLVGIIVLSIALVMLSTLFFSQGNRQVDTLFQVRAAELGQSVMNEIWSKRFDENTNSNGYAPCSTSPQKACTTPEKLGPEENSRHDWDDVDDYNGMTQDTLLPTPINGAKTYAELYPQFTLLVAIKYHNNKAKQESKLISVIVTTPNNEKIEFNALRSNF